ncbi:MAG: GC-type dockerin domain-anchored protein [Phycisphaerales bacterium]|nr:GC-type dockerin domain-anchored protein [Phycisphaerales bacterium]
MNITRFACVIGSAIVASTLHAQTISDDFESQPIGVFPGDEWNDIADRTVGSPAVASTMSVIETTDAKGISTRAVQTNQEPGTNGLYQDIEPGSSFHHLSIDVRVDSMHSANAGWPVGVGYSRYSGEDDVNANPHAVIYVWTGRVWNLFIAPGEGRPAVDLRVNGPQFIVGQWYTLTLDIDVETGLFEAKIFDADSGDLLNSVSHTYANWDSATDAFTSITVFDGGDVNSPLQGQATIDNVEYSSTPADECAVDFVPDGTLNFFDISIFLAAFTAQDSSADFTNDGSYNFFDITAFLSAFRLGCP